ncbi:MAG: cobalamin-independent methionine synthase II family protein [Rhodospirillaceae bacterium]|nr:cobalamin-independent methionine synthase II family protein [Rhodospirillaceae bacterium]
MILTSVVGSYPQPEWLIDREQLLRRLPPRVRARELWRVPADYLKQAQDDATILAIRDQERAGVDIITDGEVRRESYSNRMANALSGIDRRRFGEVRGRTGRTTQVPLVTGPIRRIEPVEVRNVEFLRSQTGRTIKMTLPGPFTMAQQAVNEYYPDDESLAMGFAEAVNEEIRDLFAAGADIVQLDEPWLESRVEQARSYAVRVINRALEGATGTTAIHVCFGYAAVVKNKPKCAYSVLPELAQTSADQISIEAAQPRLDMSCLRALSDKKVVVGVLDLNDPAVEEPSVLAQRIRAALEVIPPDRLIVAPDCGMKYLQRKVAFGKLQSMVRAAEQLRAVL